MSVDILARIKAEYEYFSRVEKSIADVILTQPEDVVTWSTSKLAQATGVSEGSVCNFSQKITDGGFYRLKVLLAGSIPQHSLSPENTPEIDPRYGVKPSMEIRIEAARIALTNTLHSNSEESLKHAADLITAAKRIEIFGLYRSGFVARDLHLQLVSLGFPASYSGDFFLQTSSAAALGKDALAIAVSNTGETGEILDIVKLAKENGAKVLSMTANRYSHLAKLSDEVLVAASGAVSVNGVADDIRLTQLLLADTLCTYLRSTMEDSLHFRSARLKEIFSSHYIKD